MNRADYSLRPGCRLLRRVISGRPQHAMIQALKRPQQLLHPRGTGEYCVLSSRLRSFTSACPEEPVSHCCCGRIFSGCHSPAGARQPDQHDCRVVCSCIGCCTVPARPRAEHLPGREEPVQPVCTARFPGDSAGVWLCHGLFCSDRRASP